MYIWGLLLSNVKKKYNRTPIIQNPWESKTTEANFPEDWRKQISCYLMPYTHCSVSAAHEYSQATVGSAALVYRIAVALGLVGFWKKLWKYMSGDCLCNILLILAGSQESFSFVTLLFFQDIPQPQQCHPVHVKMQTYIFNSLKLGDMLIFITQKWEFLQT